MNAFHFAAVLAALVRKEADGALRDPVILFGAGFLSLLGGIAFSLGIVGGDAARDVFDSVILSMLFLSILIFPVVSMRSFSEDSAAGALETLLTAPVPPFAAVFAKYAGAMAFVLVYAAQGALYAWLLSFGGGVDGRAVAHALLALAAFGSIAMSLGVLVSALASSSVAAAAGTGGILLFLTGIGEWYPSFGVLPHAKRWIAGRPDMPGLAYFTSVTALFLLYAWLAVNSREGRRPARNEVVRRRVTVTGALAAAGAVLLLVQAAVLHIHEYPPRQGLLRAPKILFMPLLFALGAFVWSALTWRAANRARRAAGRTRIQRYATITESQVMKAPRYYYEENRRARRRVWLAAVLAGAAVLGVNGAEGAYSGAERINPLVAELRVRRIFPRADSLVAGETPEREKNTESAEGAERGERLEFSRPRLRAVLWAGLVWLPLAWVLAGAAAWWLGRE